MVLPWAGSITPLRSILLSLFRPICPASCLLPLTLQSAILNYLLCLELSMLSLGLECHSSPSHPPCSHLSSKYLLKFQGSAQPSHSLQGFIYCAPPFTPGRTDYFLSGAPSPHVWTTSVCLSWTVNSLKTMSLSHASLYLDVQLIVGTK